MIDGIQAQRTGLHHRLLGITLYLRNGSEASRKSGQNVSGEASLIEDFGVGEISSISHQPRLSLFSCQIGK